MMAVCIFNVVAPPTNNGILKPNLDICLAMSTIYEKLKLLVKQLIGKVNSDIKKHRSLLATTKVL